MEVSSNKTRGRPRRFSREEIEAARRSWPWIRSDRGIQDRLYAEMAVDLIRDRVEEIPELLALYDPEDEWWMFRTSVLAELGRARDAGVPDDLVYEWALRAAERLADGSHSLAEILPMLRDARRKWIAKAKSKGSL